MIPGRMLKTCVVMWLTTTALVADVSLTTLAAPTRMRLACGNGKCQIWLRVLDIQRGRQGTTDEARFHIFASIGTPTVSSLVVEESNLRDRTVSGG